jgi:hypothetical protein
MAAGSVSGEAGADDRPGHGLEALARALFNSNEFLFVP